jgi:hypothetical protein
VLDSRGAKTTSYTLLVKIGGFSMSKDTALVVIDMQVGLIEPAYRGKEVP